MKEWISSIQKLASIATTQTHTAYSAFTHGLVSKWTYFLRPIPEISDLLQPLKEAVNLYFIPALTGKGCVPDAERDLFALPTRLGGLGLMKPMETVTHEFISSQKITAPFDSHLLVLCSLTLFSKKSGYTRLSVPKQPIMTDMSLIVLSSVLCTTCIHTCSL